MSQQSEATTPCSAIAHPVLETAGGLPATPEQLAIFEFLITRPDDNLLINASAGSSKTTTLVEGVARMVHCGTNPFDICCLAFNKSIAETLAKSMPQGVTCRTINAIGHQALRTYFTNARIDFKKKNRILAEVIPDYYNLDPASRRAISRALDIAKIHAVWPTKEQWEAGWEFIGEKAKAYPTLRRANVNPADPDEFFDRIYRENTDYHELGHLISLFTVAYTLDIIEVFRTGSISFSDQVFLPATMASISCRAFKQVFVDEAQDLSRIEQNLLEQIVTKVPKGRLVAVGDKAQAIYAFKGADPEAFINLGKHWDSHFLNLSISFRCSHAVVSEAQGIDDRIKPWEHASRGAVGHREKGEWSLRDIPPGTALLCRMNAPLVKAAIACIKNQQSVEFLGRDIANNLEDFLQLHSRNLKSLSGFWANVNLVQAEAETRSPFEAERVQDSIDCLRAIADFYDCADLDSLSGRVRMFFEQLGNIKLATIHKAKGLEWDHVGLIRPDLVPSPRALESDNQALIQQEFNMKYVAITRAKKTFTYLHGKEF